MLCAISHRFIDQQFGKASILYQVRRTSITGLFRFLDLPITVRDQAYAGLLAPLVDEGVYIHLTAASSAERIERGAEEISNVTKSLKDVFTSIMYTNRQIYVESSDTFYLKNLSSWYTSTIL